MPPDVFTRHDALRLGFTASALDSQVRRGGVQRLARGIYTSTPEDDPRAMWFREAWTLLLLRAGPTSACCSRAAAALLGLDGFDHDSMHEQPLLISAPSSVRVRDQRVRRRSHEPPETCFTDRLGLRSTGPALTVADLGRDVDDELLELALESVLRGPDPKQPDVWFEERLRWLLAETLEHPRVPGRSALAMVLRRRGDVLPTGSAAETRAAIAFRHADLALARQVRVLVYDGRRRLRHTYWLDFADVLRRVAVEVDGRIAHGSSVQIQRDYRRDNILAMAFVVLRFSATEVRDRPSTVAGVVRRRLADAMPFTGAWHSPGGVVLVPGDGVVELIVPTL